MSKQKAIVICPGRGVYTKTELGYLSKYHSGQKDIIEKLDQFRNLSGQQTISELDGAEKFRSSIHTKGENAASLIYACSYLDYLAIDRDKFDIMAITGNSMGWYLAMACANALDSSGSFHLINTMGSMLKDGLIGGQLIYPIVNESWQIDLDQKQMVLNLIDEVNSEEEAQAFISIDFGGYLVLGANEVALKQLMERLPKIDERFPMKLTGNGAFHTPLFDQVSARAKAMIPKESFHSADTTLIDGRGKIWHPKMTDIDELYEYTLNHQVTQTYEFTKAMTVALKEFAPDKLILLGPGTTMGGAIGQILVENNWLGIKSKDDFSSLQKENPFLISMGDSLQRNLVC